MKTTRKSTFETNSSSTHSITLAPGNEWSTSYIEMDFSYNSAEKTAILEGGEFGWNVHDYNDPQTKASYLAVYVCLRHTNSKREYYLNMIDNAIKQKLPLVERVIHDYSTRNDAKITSYIDHQAIENRVADHLFDSAEHISNFIFSRNSILHTDNDNRD